MLNRLRTEHAAMIQRLDRFETIVRAADRHGRDRSCWPFMTSFGEHARIKHGLVYRSLVTGRNPTARNIARSLSARNREIADAAAAIAMPGRGDAGGSRDALSVIELIRALIEDERRYLYPMLAERVAARRRPVLVAEVSRQLI